jgi:hypothetical protein
LKMWWPGTELNRRRQPFQTLFNLNLQHLTGLRETAKYLQILASRTNHGLGSWAELRPTLLRRFCSKGGASGTRKLRSLLRLQHLPLFWVEKKSFSHGILLCALHGLIVKGTAFESLPLQTVTVLTPMAPETRVVLFSGGLNTNTSTIPGFAMSTAVIAANKR